MSSRVKGTLAKRREVHRSGVIYDSKMAINLKCNIYKTVVKPAMTYEFGCWSVEKNRGTQIPHH